MKRIKQKSKWKRFICRHQFFLLIDKKGAPGFMQCWKCGEYSMMKGYDGIFTKDIKIKNKK